MQRKIEHCITYIYVSSTAQSDVRYAESWGGARCLHDVLDVQNEKCNSNNR